MIPPAEIPRCYRLAPADTLEGLLARGRGAGVLGALAAPREDVLPLLARCITVDPRWDMQLEPRSPPPRYARLPNRLILAARCLEFVFERNAVDRYTDFGLRYSPELRVVPRYTDFGLRYSPELRVWPRYTDFGLRYSPELRVSPWYTDYPSCARTELRVSPRHRVRVSPTPSPGSK